ncbi:acyltransferase [Aestuariibacter sp. AA17]|uniref:Acyltransferase n=1 Tax=Fluctibacter corallii TaxID=2984329 RepID=A0ABT3ABQ3_9ALTE|nr:acyltransferase [Aestuariibacter sp. AA17]MCV2886025.1 acyltransferase [Aestuariibacter sp. AA17]
MDTRSTFKARLENTFEIAHANHQPIYSMEGIRGFAVFLVFIVHYSTLMEPWLHIDSSMNQISHYLRRISNLGVDIFFVLCGYLIYGTLLGRDIIFRPYLKRRIKRIYPTFIVVLALYLVISWLIPSASKLPDAGIDAFWLILQNVLLLPGMFDIPAIITVAWSLSYEMFFYLAVPLVILLLRMNRVSSPQRIVCLAGIACVSLVYFSVNTEYVRMLMFLSGMMLFEVQKTKLARYSQGLGLPMLLLSFGAVIVLQESALMGWWLYAFLYFTFIVFCLDCFSQKGIANRLFSRKYLRWFGNMSYSYYLLHGLCLNAFFMVLAYALPPSATHNSLYWLALLPAFILTLVPSAALFVFIERPFSLERKRSFTETLRNTIGNTSTRRVTT